MRARAACFGASTIVNALATGRGAAFGIRLCVEVEADVLAHSGKLAIEVQPEDAGTALARACVERVSRKFDMQLSGRVATRSAIPPSRGLKSSSAAANALVLAVARSVGKEFDDLETLKLGVDAAFDAGVTITGAFDDACATYFGGVVMTDNRQQAILGRDRMPPNLVAVLAIPLDKIEKPSLKGFDFSPIAREVEDAFADALAGNYGPALERNGRAYCRVLGIDSTPAERAKRAGALAAGLTGTGPAFVALCRQTMAPAVARAMASDSLETRIVPLNTMKAPEVAA